ncbi:unnamed protein product [Calicophoron daubneyi]|uniref:Neurexin-4 n=1 Tax=Calicophoron daubneyi TaxID=300641 RepID=A0AAV2TBR9_CALDB
MNPRPFLVFSILPCYWSKSLSSFLENPPSNVPRLVRGAYLGEVQKIGVTDFSGLWDPECYHKSFRIIPQKICHNNQQQITTQLMDRNALRNSSVHSVSGLLSSEAGIRSKGKKTSSTSVYRRIKQYATQKEPKEEKKNDYDVCDANKRDTGTTLGLDGASWARIMIAAGNQTTEHLSLQFRTRIEEQIVLYTLLTNVADVNEVDNIRIVTAVYLYNGSLVFTVENYIRNGVPVLALNSMTTKVNCISAYATCADTQWHQIRQQIVKNTVLLFLDEQIPIKHSLPYSTHRLVFTEVYLGKVPPNDATNTFGPSLDSPHQPFRGCFRNVYQQGAQGKKYLLKNSLRQSTNLQLSTSARLGECDSTLLRPFPLWRIPNRSQYVTFTRPGAYIRIEGWKVVSTADISFHIVTSELDGILLYSSSVNEYDIYERFSDSDQSTAVAGAGEAGFDIFALELRNGKLVCTINTGSGSIQLGYSMLDSEQTLSSILSNGEDHFVRVRFQEGSLKVEVDQKTYVSYKADEKIYRYLNLNGIFYIGGLPESIRHISSSISPEVWSARLRQNFVGCLGDVTVNSVQWDLDLEMRACWTRGLVEKQCHIPTTSNWCANHECKNGGRCMNEWNRFTCDCSHTNFAGEFCSSAPLVASFNGHQWIRVKFASFPIHSSVENLIIRLRTKQKFGLVLTTRSPSVSASDCLELRLDNGYLLTTYDFGGQSKPTTESKRIGIERDFCEIGYVTERITTDRDKSPQVRVRQITASHQPIRGNTRVKVHICKPISDTLVRLLKENP